MGLFLPAFSTVKHWACGHFGVETKDQYERKRRVLHLATIHILVYDKFSCSARVSRLRLPHGWHMGENSIRPLLELFSSPESDAHVDLSMSLEDGALILTWVVD